MTPKETLYGYIKDHIEVLGKNLKGSTPNNYLQQELMMIKRLLERYDEQNEEILKIIKSKRQVWFEYLSKCKTYKQYNDTLLAYYDHDEKTVKEFYMNEQEFNLIKKWWIE